MAAAGFTVIAPLAVAQEQPAARSAGLEEIIVTAQKRAESAQDVPIALSVFDSSTIQAANIDRIEEIVMRTPNFTMMRTNVGEPQFYIRGVGSNSDSAAGDPTVGVFQDEIYVGRVSGAAFDVFDMERVEVLRGPQGTLYGRNTSGGAVNFVPKRPEQESYASAELSYGNYEAYEGRLVLNGGLTERLAGRLSVSHRERDGYSENITTGAELDDENNWSARGQLLFEASEASRLLVAYDFVKDDNAGNARVPFPVFDTGNSPAITAAIRNIWPKGSDLRKSYSDPKSYQDRQIDGLSARYEHDASYGTWTLLGGWRQVDLNWYEDLDGLKPYGNPVPPLPPPYGWVLRNRDVAREDAEQYSFETRLASPADSRIQWVAGLYYFTENVVRNESFETQFALVPAAGGDVTFIQDVDSTTYAAFGQLTYPVTDALSVTAGLRYSNDEKEARQAAINNLPLTDPATPGIPLFPGQPYDVTADDSWDATTGKLGVDFRTSGGHLLYGSVSKGFKSGIFPSQNNQAATVGETTPAEEVWSYEVGAKTQWLEDTLRVNLAVFYMDYSDLQLFRLDPQLRLVTFTEDTINQGAELEIVSAPLTGLELGLNAAYLSAEVNGGDNDGATLPRAPEFSVGGFAQYAWRMFGGGMSVRADAKWTDDYRTEINYFNDKPNWRITEIDAFTMVDARAAYQFADSNVEVALWGKNLTDEEVPAHIIPFLGNGFSIFMPPRTYGIALSWKSR